ncbi:hypothetical protein CONLIGDRAFT_366305 [Coniochaeta ligniaria NRRL 30616]|uniref:Rhodopsin domain-containing protein n=1 Tax=Coniochaeta ligniaria NRRL 30616 TaxID=1408157 RepID=A0A1J7JKJ3_9PEZI|nr:hypothetical protein CONLIGDRAFT_366305 [Coniochaeta ligniaria NRRL 30616]
MSMESPAPPPPPPDLISNPDDNYQANIIVCAVLTCIIAALFVGLRFYTRRFLVRILGWEDWVILVSLFFSLLNSAGAIEQVSYGFGRHELDVPLNGFIPMSRAGWYSILWYQLTIFLTKTSILLLYARILTYQHARYAVYVILVVVTLSNIWAFAVVMTACIPLAAFWDFTQAAGAYCHPRSFWWANTGLHMATDFLIFGLPMPIIFHLNASPRQKVLLYGIFAFGFLVSLMSVIRLVYLLQEYNHDDFTYDNTTLMYWTCIEVNTAIVCACVMTLKPLMNRYLPSLVRSRMSAPSGNTDAVDSGGHRPLTIGSRPVRKGQANRRSWLVLPDRMDTDALMGGEEEELELVGSKRDIEAHLDRKIGLPTRPESMYIRDPRSPSAASTDGPEVRPSSAR